MIRIYICGFICVILAMGGCRKPFVHDAITKAKSMIIIEGTINTEGPTTIFLSRSQDLDDMALVKPEQKAKIQLEGTNSVFPFSEQGNGVYTLAQLNLDNAQKYRLRVKTSAGAEYLSELMAVRTTPPIDSVNWVREADGIGIYVNAHDESNNTRYYQWSFDETWELRSVGFSSYVTSISGGKVTAAPRADQEIPRLYNCWKNTRSANILISSTATLSSDIVIRYPLGFIPNTSEKLDIRYSMLVRQTSITFEAYEYLNLMKKNSEQQGSFFDSQPSELIGNIKNINDPDDLAIGYIGIASVKVARIFIDRSQIQNWGFRLICTPASSRRDSLEQYFSPLGPNLISDFDPVTASYSGFNSDCLDCRHRGGNNIKPGFW